MGAACRVFGRDRRSAEVGRWLRNLCGVSENCRLLLYVGRLVPEKRLDLLVEIMDRLELEVPGAFHLLIAGDGCLRAHLETEFSRRANGAARFLGHVGDRDALADLYANCDIFLHPNPREPFGIAPLEAMASGLPVVAPNSGGVTSYASSGNAWLADCNPAAFTEAVYRICNNSAAAASRAEAARATAEQYDWEKVTGGFFDLYDQLHSYVQGAVKEPVSAPAFYSTAGNQFGWER
jgi:alpha-1,6-mannosyltransferase